MQVGQALGMPEAARHASAVLSLVPGHAALRSGDVGATLQQQQRLTKAIWAGTATLHLDEHPGISVGALALSSDLSQWATISQSSQKITVTVWSREGIVCQQTLAGSRERAGLPVFNHDNCRLGVPYITSTEPRMHACSVALLSLTQPAQQPVVVVTSSWLHLAHSHSIVAAPSADLFVVSTHTKKLELSTLSGDGAHFRQHEVPRGALAPDDQLYSPDSRFLCLLTPGEVHCLEICHGIWHSRQRPPSRYLDPIWLQLPACMPRLLMREKASLALIIAPRLTTSHSQPLPKLPCDYTSLGLSLVSGISTDHSMHIFQVLPDAPVGQPFMCLVLTLVFSPAYHRWATSPDGCFLLLCCPEVVSSDMRHIVVYDLQSAVEIRRDTLHLHKVDTMIWCQEGLSLARRQRNFNVSFRAARWLT